jgi:hypothetical protein
MATHLEKAGYGQNERKIAEEIREFRERVTTKLPRGYTALRQLPNLYQMLESLGEARKYSAYIVGCQYAHGTHHATRLFRKLLGSLKEVGEFISPKDWWACFALCWISLREAGGRYTSRIGGDATSFLDPEFGDRVRVAIEAVRDG